MLKRAPQHLGAFFMTGYTELLRRIALGFHFNLLWQALSNIPGDVCHLWSICSYPPPIFHGLYHHLFMVKLTVVD